jgi:K+-sensing histidine kinase KdpD
VSVRFRSRSSGLTLATLYGSQPWIERVLLECLEAAIRSTRSQGALDIEYCQMGPRALIIFRDCGVFRPTDDPDAVEMKAAQPAPAKSATPARSAKPAPRLTARDQIGLKLCQHVIAMHGGLLREEDEGGLRNFLIDLPTGAPHREDHAQLDIEQAQVYARDLSALMTRARRRPTA